MSEGKGKKRSAELRQVLGFRDMVLLSMSSVVGLTTLSQVAQFGYASLFLILAAILTFFIPCGLMVAELNYRMPVQGGFYVWIKEAFGEFHAYVAAWSFWLCNVVWFPTALLLVSSSLPYLLGPEYVTWKDNVLYNVVFCFSLLWGITWLNIRGLEKAKWVQNVGALATWTAILLLGVLGTIFWIRQGAIRPFSWSLAFPNLRDFAVLPFFAAVAFSFGGLELGPVMSGEMEHPRRNLPRALALASVLIGLVYILGTLMVIISVPGGELSTIEGIAQAFVASSASLGAGWMGGIGIFLITLSTLGLFGAWFAGNARIPFVIGLDDYLPEAVTRLHPRFGSPHRSLLGQAIIVTIFFLGSTVGTTIKDAFQVLFDMSILLYFIPFLYMFAALIFHVRKDTSGGGLLGLFRSRIGLWLIAGSGFLVTLISVVLSVFPSGQVEQKGVFVLKVLGGAVLLLGLGLVVYWRKKMRSSS